MVAEGKEVAGGRSRTIFRSVLENELFYSLDRLLLNVNISQIRSGNKYCLHSTVMLLLMWEKHIGFPVLKQCFS